MILKGSQTEKNLQAAFAGESQARNKYSYFASVARKEGFVQIADLFEETAGNEKEHAKVHFKFLGGIGNTLENLQEAIDGEHYEQSVMYPEFAKTARAEGFEEIAKAFEAIGSIELNHEKRYAQLRENIKNQQVFQKDQAVNWKCSNCGFIHHDKSAPDLCPACKHAKSYFQVQATNY